MPENFNKANRAASELSSRDSIKVKGLFFKFFLSNIKIHDLISKQEDLIHCPDKIYYLLLRYHLLDKYITGKLQGKVTLFLI